MDVDSILAKLPSGYKFLPTDLEIIDCLKSRIESRNPPPWCVHIVCFRNYKPQELAEKYKAASDHKWYFVTSWPVNVSYHLNETKPGWKVTHNHTPMELRLYNKADGQLVGYKQNFEFLDENSHKTEWLMCVYYVEDPNRGTNKLSPFVLCKMYKDNEEEEGRGDSILAKLPSGYKFLPTDSEIIDYLKRRIESRNPPPWRVHLVCFRNHKPQELAEKYQAASDHKWYFVTSWPINVSYHWNETKPGWKVTHKHTPMELRLYNKADGQLVGYKQNFEFLDENSHKTEWLMCVYYVEDPNRGTNKLSPFVLCKMYEDNEEGRGDSIRAKLPFGYKFLLTDSEIIDYLKRRIESRNPPPWRVHLVCFRNHKPQELAEKYQAASDNRWYFVTSWPVNMSYHLNETRPCWKGTHKHTPMESRVYNEADGQLVGYKQNFEFLDENNHKTEWLMSVYYVVAPNRGTNKVSRVVLCKMFKDNEEDGRGDSILPKLPSGYEFLPTDSKIIDYLKRRIESRNPPPWRVHIIFFRNLKPQELAEKYPTASDNKWYFIIPGPLNASYDSNETKPGWKVTHKHTPMELCVYNEADGQLVGYKQNFEFLDKNSHKTEWLMCVYYVAYLIRGTKKVSRFVLCKMYKDNEEEEGRGGKRPRRG